MQFPPRRQRALLAGIGLFAAAGAVQADEKVQWTVSGFGTAGAVHSSSRDADFVASILKENGVGATRRTGADVDSRLGVQLGVEQGKWSAVLQLISEQHTIDSYQPIVEWGNVKYQATPDLAVRAGRIALPMFLAAEYRKVGYAFPWARTPVEMYGTIPLTNSDGVDATYRWSEGGRSHVTQAFYGRTDAQYDATYTAQARNLGGFAHTVTSGALTARVSAMRADVTLALGQPLYDAFRQFGPQGAAIADRYEARDKRACAVSVGLNYDPGQWFATGEAGRLNTHSYIGDKTAFYVSAGYRAGSLTAYTSFARVSPNSPTQVAGLALDGMPAQQAALGAMLNYHLNDMLRYVASQRTASVGLRWDAADNVAVKLQHDRLTTRDGSYGTLIRIQPGYQAGKPVGLTSVMVDFVF
ncbi:hypothetical protein [Pseudoduganella sp. GCM10020061]|uniref:hypothetical protein n=1 Tax=Pseudoduganella sp. GCM10020061 TaxID=3317345 RepID=UPI0036359FC3